jgi:integrase
MERSAYVTHGLDHPQCAIGVASHELPIRTFGEFVAKSFYPNHVTVKRQSGRRHYQAILKHVLSPIEVDSIFTVDQPGIKARLGEDPNWPYLSRIPLTEVNEEHIQAIVSAAVEKGYSAQTVKHIRNVIRVIFSHAIKNKEFFRENPAANMALPAMKRREAHSLSLGQTEEVFKRMHYPEREMAVLAMLTDMSIAEICGLKWMHINLTDTIVTREGIEIPPRSIAIRNQLYRGVFSPVQAFRVREIPISLLLLSFLRSLSVTRPSTWQDFVLTTKLGKPINQINLAARRLKRIGAQLNMPWISWQVFRRTRRSILQQYERRGEDHLSRAILPAFRRP